MLGQCPHAHLKDFDRSTAQSMNFPLRRRRLDLSFLALAALLTFANCASITPYEQSVAIDAGFRPAAVEEPYASVPPYHVQRVAVSGKEVFVYRDERRGVTYVGGLAEYQRYQELIQSRGAERMDRLTRQMNQETLHGFGH